MSFADEPTKRRDNHSFHDGAIGIEMQTPFAGDGSVNEGQNSSRSKKKPQTTTNKEEM